FYLTLIALLINSCLSKYVLTDKEIKKHYAKKEFSPCFGMATYKGKLVHYAQTGNDTMPTVLFIHGGPGAWYGWIDFMDDDSLRKKFNMVSVDRLGYGKSDYGKAELSTEEQVNSILEVMKKFPTDKKIIVVGRSYGAPIAAMVSKELGKQVGKLILISPVVHPDKEKFYWFSPIIKSRSVNWMFPKFVNVASKEKYAHAKEMKKILPEWKDVKCNTVVVAGGKDWVAEKSNYLVTDTLLKNCCSKEMIYLPEASHWIATENKGLVKELILKRN
ncbi:MAG: alpha/beta hydrolase, partial [Bacteroidia bacterium]|nr:alpha/beta hydrolase [Bacteroidia bacterium]